MTTDEAADLVAQITGRRPPRETIARWVKVGVGGVRLAARRCGWRWAIDPKDVRAFLDALNDEVVA